MAPIFVFVKDVEAILRDGKQEIIIPEGARISPAALDLIQERGIRVARPAHSEPLPAQEAPETSNTQQQTPGPSTEETSSNAVSDEDLETIIDRIIDRLRQVKGATLPAAAEQVRNISHDDDMIICRCEEITKGDIKEAIRNGMGTLNGIKRVTRAGMGLCQGQTCQRLVSQILVSELGLSAADIEPSTARAPVRPVRLSIFATG